MEIQRAKNNQYKIATWLGIRGYYKPIVSKRLWHLFGRDKYINKA